MKKYNIFVLTSIAWSSLLALGPTGCSGGGASSKKDFDPNPEGAHIAKVAEHIVNYLVQPENRQRHPKDSSEMKDWAAKNKIPEDELVSTRDHEPYQIHQLRNGAVTVITEATGVNGKKYMFIHRQGPRPPVGSEVTQEEIDNALKAAGTRGRRGGGSR